MPMLGAPTIGEVGLTKPTALSVYRVTIYTADKKNVLNAMLGPESPESTEGRAGWEEVARDRKPSITQWTGSNARKLTLTVLLDAYSANGTVEAALKIVEKMAPVNPTAESPTLYVNGVFGVSSSVPWKLNALTFAERIRRPKDGATQRVMVTFELIQYNPGNVIARTSPAKRSNDKNKSKTKTKSYTVKKGDTLSSLAAKYLGSASKWKTLATLNGLRSPTGLKVGSKIKLPA